MTSDVIRWSRRLAVAVIAAATVAFGSASQASTVFVDATLFVSGADLTGVFFTDNAGSGTAAPAGAEVFLPQDRLVALDAGGSLLAFDYLSVLTSTGPATSVDLALLLSLSGDTASVRSVSLSNLVVIDGGSDPATAFVLPDITILPGDSFTTTLLGSFNLGGHAFVALQGDSAFTTVQATPIPLPAPVLLIVSGLAALTVVGRRRAG